MVELLNKRISYNELFDLAKSASYGKIILNVDGRPILYHHPYTNECLLLGYHPQTKEISFAQSIFAEGPNSSIIHEVQTVKDLYNSFKDYKFEVDVIAKIQTTQEFIQNFFFLYDFCWNEGKVIMYTGGDVIAYSAGYNMSNKRRLLYLTDSDDCQITFDTFWKRYFNFEKPL